MQHHATLLEFEKAQEYKQKLTYLSVFQEKSLVVNSKITDVMVISIVSNETRAFLNFLDIQNGSIIHTETFEAEKKLDEPDEEILIFSMFALKDKYKSTANEIITNIATEIKADGFTFGVPQIGDKRKLLEMSLKNAFFAQKEALKLKENQAEKYLFTLKKLQEDLRLQELPIQIECFDNSNIQGTNPVASMVYFKSGKPSKSNYRHFHIKTVVGPDDFASMYEIVTRRYKRQIEEQKPLPQLVIIDGGKGQLSSACQALKDLGIYGKFAIIGIAKRLEEVYFPEDSIPLYLNKKSESLKLIQRIRNEAHRFAITFHRDVRSKNSIKSELIEIEGFGEKTMQKLYLEFKSLNTMKQASLAEIEKVVGKAKAQIFWLKMHPETEITES
jgi:excinuclease ABC subunit C